MKLVKIDFIDFKSISGDSLDIEKDVTCLVGINESGKSNILIALERADQGQALTPDDVSRHSESYSDSTKTPELKLFFEPQDEEKNQLEELIGTKSLDTLIITKIGSEYRLDFPAIEYKKSKFFQTPDQSQSAEGTDNATTELTDEQTQSIRSQAISEIVTNFLPKFLRFDSVNFNEYFLPDVGEIQINEFIGNPDGFRPVKNLLYLGKITNFSELQASDDKQRIRRDTLLKRASEAINNQILRVVWPVETVEVELSAEGEILKIRLKEKDRTSPFKPIERSRGLQWALAFNVYFLAETQQELKGRIFLVDEPGIFLHIDGQKKLLEKTFPQIVKQNNQIIYTTHLPYLIDASYPERIRILEKIKEETIIGNKAWSQGEFGKIPEPVRTALGLNWENVFQFSDKNIIIEGPSDQLICRVIDQQFNQKEPLPFLPAYGAEKIPTVLALAKLEEKDAFGLVDGDKDLSTLRQKCSMVSIPEDLLDSIDNLINDKSIITIEDLLPDNIFQEAVFKVYEPICKRRGNCSLKQDEIPTNKPRVKNVEAFFADKFQAKTHKLLKMDLARAIVEIVSQGIRKTDSRWQLSKKFITSIAKRVK